MHFKLRGKFWKWTVNETSLFLISYMLTTGLELITGKVILSEFYIYLQTWNKILEKKYFSKEKQRNPYKS